MSSIKLPMKLLVKVCHLISSFKLVVVIINKLPSLWKDFKNTLRHKTKEVSLESLINQLRIEEES